MRTSPDIQQYMIIDNLTYIFCFSFKYIYILKVTRWYEKVVLEEIID